SEFSKYKDSKAQKKLAVGYDYFIAQANLMPKIAAGFGKVLGTRGKMPNPKLGCVVPPSVNLEPLVKKLNYTLRLAAKKGLNLQCVVGKEGQAEEEIIDNILAVYQAAAKNLPNEIQNIKNVSLKTTMGKPVKI
ncbi:MAG TPA: 50S ribosomal protein L1, partial [Candidatus Nanoarchaeia archaeon]|nr:50S ribosomal protein L1 [Candidatus Nanoarchaeia archaeon]